MMTEQVTDTPHDDPADHVNYFIIFGILCILTVISVAADLLPIGRQIILLTAIALSVAVAKALFVMLYFMHLKFEKKWKYVLLSPTIMLAAGLPLSLISDISVHYYPVVNPQVHASGTVFEPEWKSPEATSQHNNSAVHGH